MSELSRASFDIPSGLTYLNCAYLSPLTRQVVEAGRQAVLRKAHPWQIVYKDFFAEVERLRGLFAGLIGANPDDTAVVPSTAYGIATAAANLPLTSGDNLVVPLAEHASTFHRWRVAATESGAELREAKLDNHRNWADAIIAGIDRNTRIVSVPHVHWSDGRLFDLQRIGKAARDVGAAFVVDGTQSIGALPFSVADLRPDFVTCSAYKWLLCPYGFGFLYVAPRFQEGRPLEEHFFHRSGVAEHEGKLEQLEGYDTGARRFDTAERASFINVAMSVVALEQLSGWSVTAIRDRITPVTERILAAAAKMGYRAAAPDQQAVHLFGLRRDGGLPAGIGKALQAANVHVSIRGDAIRVSPHVFNDAADADRLVAALASAR
jgi:selenocysteine lyase/cysteine desulfurase